MEQRTFHLAIIMDGNGRWARQRGLPRIEGHRRGADSVRRTIEAAPALGITDLTLYAFSSDNWKRPADEVSALMRLLSHYLETEARRCRRNGVRLSVIGRRDRLDPQVRRAIEKAEDRTRNGRTLHVRLAIDYSSRDAILEAARACAGSRTWTRTALSSALPPDVDLLVRTGREQRLSDFLLWECAYAEFVFLDRLWPEFCADDLAAALAAYRSRERRFGAVPAA
jgi:undecaprenyl diphosphate synthase